MNDTVLSKEKIEEIEDTIRDIKNISRLTFYTQEQITETIDY